ncbi:hypothetical protein AC579_1143 [Pseudocercospora musae]|uniref:NAD-dependent epimerase/dehydratase domain-containing protein n=1 Tax=Pseudocercospora musae TaxID=113226 RepID=A0A139HGV6_9PEZI|nr:hypothetical protein AC579_1143 [Pseudocercospora musae]
MELSIEVKKTAVTCTPSFMFMRSRSFGHRGDRQPAAALSSVQLSADDGKHYVMIVGGNGYIGLHTTLELSQESHNVIVVDDLGKSYETVQYKLDYRTSAMKDVFRMYTASGSNISALIHFAAFKPIVQDKGIKNFAFSSSATVYGGKASTGKPLSETDLVHFDENIVKENGGECQRANGIPGITNSYGRTKHMAGAILADFAKAESQLTTVPEICGQP